MILGRRFEMLKKKHHPLKSRRDMGGSFTAVSEWFRAATLNWIQKISFGMMVWDGMSARRFVWLIGWFDLGTHRQFSIFVSHQDWTSDPQDSPFPKSSVPFPPPPFGGKKNWTSMIAYGMLKRQGFLNQVFHWIHPFWDNIGFLLVNRIRAIIWY